MTIFFGTLLSLTRMTLEPRQKKQEEIDTKKKILGAVVNVSEYEPEAVSYTHLTLPTILLV